MKKENNFSKVILFLTITAFAIWLGSYISRMFIFYEFILPVSFDIDSKFLIENFSTLSTILNPLLVVSLSSYIILLVLLIAYLLVSRISIKNNGWLFITICLIFLLSPLELYLSYYDYIFITKVLSKQIVADDLIGIVILRAKEFGVFALIHIFTSIFVILLQVFKPLVKNEN
ncbi:MAG: hypothetical protein KF816_09240 [Melioribacteraceae bacterium]|nr:hypothetical protein [Melioribacteraceae bacterium]